MSTSYQYTAPSGGNHTNLVLTQEFQAIQTALERVLNLYNDTPNGQNALQDDIDCNNQFLYNLPDPVLDSHPVTLGYATANLGGAAVAAAQAAAAQASTDASNAASSASAASNSASSASSSASAAATSEANAAASAASAALIAANLEGWEHLDTKSVSSVTDIIFSGLSGNSYDEFLLVWEVDWEQPISNPIMKLHFNQVTTPGSHNSYLGLAGASTGAAYYTEGIAVSRQIGANTSEVYGRCHITTRAGRRRMVLPYSVVNDTVGSLIWISDRAGGSWLDDTTEITSLLLQLTDGTTNGRMTGQCSLFARSWP